MPNSMMPEKTTISDSILDSTSASTSIGRKTLVISKGHNLANRPKKDEAQPSTTITNSKALSTIIQSDDSTTIPLTLDPMIERHLSTRMLIKYEELLPTTENFYRRISLVQKIERLLDKEWPNKGIKAILFGSSVNGLGTNQSDVDICIAAQGSGPQSVGTLAKLFRQYGMQQVVCVPCAQVPIVRLFDAETQLACDININSTIALHNTTMIRTYIAIDPRVRPLAMAIKHWAKQRNLNDAAEGGTLSIYTWTCMIINFLQMRQPPILPVLHQMKDLNNTGELFCTDIEQLRGFGQSNYESLGGLLFAFFRRYSIEFDYEDQVISVRHGRYLTKDEKGWNLGRNKASLCVEEPFNIGRNLGNSADSRSIRGIRMELNRALEMLIAGVDWEIICAPYRPLTCGTLAPVDGTTNGNDHIVSSYYQGNYRSNRSTLYTQMERIAPPPSLSSASTSSSSSSTSSPSASLPSPSSQSSASPPPISLLFNHQSGHRSPSQQQKIIDAIATKYVTNDMIPSQQPYHHQNGYVSQLHTRHHPRQKKASSYKQPPNMSNNLNATINHSVISQGKSEATISQRKPKDTHNQHQQQRRRRHKLAATKKSEPANSLELPAHSSNPPSAYTVEIKLPTKERFIIDNGNISTHYIPPTSNLHLDGLNDTAPGSQISTALHR